MKSNVLIMNCESKIYLIFKDFESGNWLLSGTIDELERENNKAYKRLKDRHIKDFYILPYKLVIWV